ncbi:ABC transporter substrate-binding protein [Flavobacterium agricola]|uniref:ABC transporter substrate-binding protein n=1 Tax=Flavobacterium agricola TaxID=2870839 RepID=A0ABY6M367_9FLAO|nr:ABC transporter substrate-binding protein [Flavobacterium agricola]UYW02307.1 ABC transporter substrate-binding protein [Flavobacterium agricola]
MKLYAKIISACAVLIMLASCKEQATQTAEKEHAISVTDTKGNLVTLDKPAERIVCLFDPALDLLTMLGATDKVVGIPIDVYVDQELYQPFSLLNQDIANKTIKTPGSNELQQLEEIVALKPDLLIVQNLNPGMVQTLKNMGVATYMFTSESQANLMQELQDVSVLTGKQERGLELENYAKSQFAKLTEQANAIPEKQRKSVYFTWANGRIYSTTGRNSMMNDCLVLAGTTNVCTSAIDQPNINPETLVSWNPDMIVMWNDDPNLFYKKPELANVTAIKNKAIHNLMPMFFYNPHTLKSICAAIAIKEWAYGNQENANAQVREVIEVLYGKEKAQNLLTLLN